MKGGLFIRHLNTSFDIPEQDQTLIFSDQFHINVVIVGGYPKHLDTQGNQ